ncbi:MAG: COQ9 family protein [Pseudomonadota bacterium]
MAEDQETLTALQDRLIEAVLTNVPFDGWSQAAIDAAAASSGMEPGDAYRCFPGGPLDAMAHFSDWADRMMLAAIEEAGAAYDDLKIREKIAFGVRTRLTLLEPHKEAVRMMSGIMARPQHVTKASRLVWKTVDAMWYAAGDTATDFNHYTKRGLLAGVQTSTVLFWLADRSDEHERTWAFLDRRIANVLAIGMRIGKVTKMGARMPDPSKMAKWTSVFRNVRPGAKTSNDDEPGPTVH